MAQQQQWRSEELGRQRTLVYISYHSLQRDVPLLVKQILTQSHHQKNEILKSLANQYTGQPKIKVHN